MMRDKALGVTIEAQYTLEEIRHRQPVGHTV